MLRHERLAHLATNFERTGPDRGPEPGHQLRTGAANRRHSFFQYACCKPAPAGMRSGHSSPVHVTEQHGQTIGRQHSTGDACSVRPAGIRDRASSRISFNSRARMYLTHPGRPAGECAMQPLSICSHNRRVITYVIAQIETVERCLAQPPVTRRYASPHMRGRRPIGGDPVVRPAIHPMNASRSCCSSVSSQTKSSGNGDSHFIRVPLTGWSNSRKRACSA